MPPYHQPRQLEDDFEAAVAAGTVDACLAAEREAGLPPGLLLAISSRETGCRNIAVDEGHRRGALGIDDRKHSEWLSGRGAAGPGAIPPVDTAARYVAGLIAAQLVFGRANGVPETDLLMFALSAYGSSAGAALEGYRRGDSDVATPGANYGRDVLDRMAAAELWLADRTEELSWPRLEPGARGRAVVELKRLLREWYASRGELPPRRMRGPSYRTGAVEAVKEFQRASGLTVDGIVGPETWRALSAGADAPQHGSGTAA